MAGRHKKPGDKPWWVARSIEKAGRALPSGSGLDGIVNVSGFAPVASPPVKAPEKPTGRPSYEPESKPEPEYQPQPEGSGEPPSTPPKKRGGLSGWQKAVIGAGIPILVLASYFGISALRNQQYQPVSTPTPIVATATPMPTATYAPTPTATPIPGIDNLMSEAQLKATLEEVLAIDRYLTPDDTEVLKKMEDINKTLYFMLSGKTVEQQNFGTRIVTREEYDSKVPEGLKGTAGTVVRGNDGIEYIYAALPQKPKELITTLASETGQGWLLKEGPLNMDVGVTNPNPYLGIRGGEMKDALYRAAVINKIKELGVNHVQFLPSKNSSIDAFLYNWLANEHFFIEAWAATWAFALDDSEASANLKETGWAGSEVLIRMFKYNAMLDYKQNTFEENVKRREEFENKLTKVLQNKASYAPQIKSVIEKRVSPEGKLQLVSMDALP